MEEQLQALRAEAESRLRAASSVEELEQVSREYLAKKGSLTQILRGMGKLPPEQRPVVGKLANETRSALQELVDKLRQDLTSATPAPTVGMDVTLPARSPRIGVSHPLKQVEAEICDQFISLGFEVVEGPEVETEWFNFIALNIGADHPARDDHDSFYITDDVLLRTETSAVQIHVMEGRQPPIRVIAPGRVYRRDAVDSTHSHTFHQVEGLLVDEEVTFADLKGALALFARRFFGGNVETRFRPHYFPFTEPSAEVDVSCSNCEGRGCSVCGHAGWIEVLGCGMVHNQVLANVGYDTEKYIGFAFGMGIERLAMLKYGIDDIRLFYENDVRFLRQF